VSPSVQPVIFDGKAHAIDANTAVAWRQIDANTFERKLSNKDRLLSTRTIRISPDGKTLTWKVEGTRGDGKPRSVESRYQREGSGTGLVGRWKVVSTKSNPPSELHIERNGPSGINWTNELGNGVTMALDGKPATMTGPSIIAGTMQSARLTAERTLETVQPRWQGHRSDGLRSLSRWKDAHTNSDAERSGRQAGGFDLRQIVGRSTNCRSRSWGGESGRVLSPSASACRCVLAFLR